MRAVVLREPGPPENLRVEEVPVPPVGDNDILIKTELAGLIHADAEIRRGTYSFKPELPWIPGRDVGGEVVARGKNVTGFNIGDRVLALVLGGRCAAEYVAAPVAQQMTIDAPAGSPETAEAIVLPDTVRMEQALPYLINYRFAYLLVDAQARVQPGQSLFIHGAAGGMGTSIIHHCAGRGFQVIALCRGDEETEYCRQLGADHTVDVTRDDYVEAVLALTGGKGANYSFNGVGGDTINRDPQALAPFGEILAYGYVAGRTPFDPYSAAGRCVAVKSFGPSPFVATGDFARATEAMLERFRTGPLMEVTRTFSFDEAAEAHRWLDEGRMLGTIALRP
jgi:NADPH2:quinone reductase